jgi:transaldolase
MNIEIYADGADYKGIIEAAKNEKITGFTTNPTLMKQAGISDYEGFARRIITDLKTMRPGTNISLEVFADDVEGMYAQAKKIAAWGKKADYDVYVKIPITNTHGESNAGLVRLLNEEGVKVNVTAVFTPEQTKGILENINTNTPIIISIFAGRIADTLRDPVHSTRDCVNQTWNFEPKNMENVKFLWASCREQYHLIMAEQAGCHIITMLHDQIKKLHLTDKNLEEFSRETVQMFYNDATASGFRID